MVCHPVHAILITIFYVGEEFLLIMSILAFVVELTRYVCKQGKFSSKHKGQKAEEVKDEESEDTSEEEEDGEEADEKDEL